MPQSLEKLYKKIIVEIVTKHLPTCKIYLYGSRARKDASQGSDVDIALDNHSKIKSSKLLSIKNDLEDSQLPVFFDIVDIKAVSDEMKKEIMKDKVLWKN